jgi:diacylglycerol kinase (ATP)
MAGHYGHMPRGMLGTFKALRWSMQGLQAAWLHEASFRLEVVLAAVLLPAAALLGATGLEKALLMGSVLGVLALELLNSAIEAVIERYGAEHHELAGRAKDMGSAAVFIGILSTVATWGCILLG